MKLPKPADLVTIPILLRAQRGRGRRGAGWNSQFQNQDLAVRVERTSGSGLGFLQGTVWQEVGGLADQARAAKRFFDVITPEGDGGIDLVRQPVVVLVAFEADIVGSGADPERLAIHREWRFPDPQMVARGDYLDGLGVRPAIILGASEEIKRAHGHGEIGLFRKTGNRSFEDGGLDVGVDFDPARRGEYFLHGFLVA